MMAEDWAETLAYGGVDEIERQFSLGTAEVIVKLSPMGNGVSIIDEDCNERRLPRLKAAIERELPQYDDIRSDVDGIERDTEAFAETERSLCWQNGWAW